MVRTAVQDPEEYEVWSLAPNKDVAISEVLKQFKRMEDVKVMSKFLQDNEPVVLDVPTAFIQKRVPQFMP